MPELTHRLEERLNQTSLEAVQTSIREDNHRPYMIHQLNVEGPDNAPFVITDTDSRTPIGDIAITVLSQYDNPAIFKDNLGKPSTNYSWPLSTRRHPRTIRSSANSP